jgi:hypothetical protein
MTTKKNKFRHMSDDQLIKAADQLAEILEASGYPMTEIDTEIHTGEITLDQCRDRTTEWLFDQWGFDSLEQSMFCNNIWGCKGVYDDREHLELLKISYPEVFAHHLYVLMKRCIAEMGEGTHRKDLQ